MGFIIVIIIPTTTTTIMISIIAMNNKVYGAKEWSIRIHTRGFIIRWKIRTMAYQHISRYALLFLSFRTSPLYTVSVVYARPGLSLVLPVPPHVCTLCHIHRRPLQSLLAHLLLLPCWRTRKKTWHVLSNCICNHLTQLTLIFFSASCTLSRRNGLIMEISAWLSCRISWGASHCVTLTVLFTLYSLGSSTSSCCTVTNMLSSYSASHVTVIQPSLSASLSSLSCLWFFSFLGHTVAMCPFSSQWKHVMLD